MNIGALAVAHCPIVADVGIGLVLAVAGLAKLIVAAGVAAGAAIFGIVRIIDADAVAGIRERFVGRTVDLDVDAGKIFALLVGFTGLNIFVALDAIFVCCGGAAMGGIALVVEATTGWGSVPCGFATDVPHPFAIGTRFGARFVGLTAVGGIVVAVVGSLGADALA